MQCYDNWLYTLWRHSRCIMYYVHLQQLLDHGIFFKKPNDYLSGQDCVLKAMWIAMTSPSTEYRNRRNIQWSRRYRRLRPKNRPHLTTIVVRRSSSGTRRWLNSSMSLVARFCSDDWTASAVVHCRQQSATNCPTQSVWAVTYVSRPTLLDLKVTFNLRSRSQLTLKPSQVAVEWHSLESRLCRSVSVALLLVGTYRRIWQMDNL